MHNVEYKILEWHNISSTNILPWVIDFYQIILEYVTIFYKKMFKEKSSHSTDN